MTTRVSAASGDAQTEMERAFVEVRDSGPGIDPTHQARIFERFERAFAALVGAKHVVACATGSAALHLSYLLSFEPGDEVLVPALTFLSTATMLIAIGATPVCVDVDPETWLIDIDDAERRLTRKTKGIVPVHLFGNPCNPAVIGDFANRHGLKIIWDAAQAHGAQVGSIDVGAFEPLVCYSLYATKNLNTGEGGLICTDSGEIAQKLRTLRSHGIAANGLCDVLGFNYRMTDIAGAIGHAQLNLFPERRTQRRRNAQRLSAGLASVVGLQIQGVHPESQSAWHHFSVTVCPDSFGMSRDELSLRLAIDGIASNIYYLHPLSAHPVIQAAHDGAPCPVATRLSSELLAIPVHPALVESDIDRIVAAIHRAAANAQKTYPPLI